MKLTNTATPPKRVEKKYDFQKETLPSFLDPHQKVGITWALSRRASYLNHAPGAGKTLQAITASLLSSGFGQTLFIVPPSIVETWRKEIEKWAPRIVDRVTYSFVKDSAAKTEVNWEADILIIPDSMITKDWVRAGIEGRTWKFIAIDEASRFKEPMALRTITLFGGFIKKERRFGFIRGARHVVLLDGSPAPTSALDFWAPTYALSPKSINHMSHQSFALKYCNAYVDAYGRYQFSGSRNEEELSRRLHENFMHTVKESDLSHPERLRSLTFIDKDIRSKEQRLWEARNLSEFRIRDFVESDSLGALAKHRADLGLQKVPFITKRTKECLEKNESVLLFVWHRDVALALKKSLAKYKPGFIIGGIKPEERSWAYGNFQSGQSKLLILNITAGGRGLNLQKADRVIFGEFSWSNETNLQAEKRASRKGSTKEFVRCEYIVAPNSIDEIVLKSVFRKEEMGRKIFG